MAVQRPSLGRSWPIVAGFDWDGGNRDKCRQHGLSLRTIEAVFHEPVALFHDPVHSGDEERLKAIGKTSTGRSALIVFTLREREGQIFIRPISARYMHAKEVANYEEEAAKLEQR